MPVSEGPYRNMDEKSPQKKSRRLSVKDLADQMIPEDATVDPKPYAKLLLPNERVVYDSSVWKRSVSDMYNICCALFYFYSGVIVQKQNPNSH